MSCKFNHGESVAVCDYCGTTQTLPRLDDDRRANLYDRANHFRRNNDFDKAAGIYEQILTEDNTDAEAYWSLVLCRYGIEYVEDPASHGRVPTVNRAQYTSIFDDDNYKSALQYADSYQRSLYESEAKAINEIQKGILAISQQEEPFDIFICYKETDNNGRRTPDSVLATDLYHQLTQEGFKVFFSRITLEDKLGSAYEPYIFAALNSARVMVVLGTRPEHFNAVWVKNEWSRYLSLIKQGQKNILIPAYRDMDPYDLPEEFSHLQAQDMSKLGFMQDLIRGIQKIVGADAPKPIAAKETVVTGNTNIAPLLKRAFMFLEDGEWSSADEYCEKVLDIDPENAQAYLGKLMAKLRVRKQEYLADHATPFEDNNNYRKAVRFGDDALQTALNGYITHIEQRNREAQLSAAYGAAKAAMDAAKSESAYKKAAESFGAISQYRDADQMQQQCLELAEECRKNAIYDAASSAAWIDTEEANMKAAGLFAEIPGWKDADIRRDKCQTRVRELAELKARRAEEARLAAEKKAEEERIAAEKRAEEERLAAEKAAKERAVRKRRNTKVAAISAAVLCVVAAVVVLVNTIIIPSMKYKEAVALVEAGNTAQAAIAFGSLDYKDSVERSMALWDKIAVRDTIASSSSTVIGLKTDCTVCYSSAYDVPNEVADWTDLVAVATCGTSTVVGLKSDGTVLTTRNIPGTSEWTNIVAVAAEHGNIVGLRLDGTVVACGGTNSLGECNVSDWTDIVAISACETRTVGLKADGTVVATGYNNFGQGNVSHWSDIVAIAANSHYTVGLKADGTVVTVGNNEKGCCDVGNWTDIVAVATGTAHTVGLKADGTVVAVGYNRYGQRDVSDWTDIVAIAAGTNYTIGLKADGSIVQAGSLSDCSAADWTNIRLPKAGHQN